ncbi:putative chlorophyll(ide) b reductase NYC1, chloroplastic [Cocos nucifera]|uniref:Putative chlorophyll(Ide) b reductase NYC1, chloroplastic n=1 Tax=Cocos nucifera TaxID=13894 RepID=A0A8K0MZ24_COCNU|nr:putative chlorophyll(ide) b reductase NYC1, chloroplastic [Cocos nucifera]
MAAGVAKLQLSAHPFNHLGSRDLSRSDRRPRLRSDPHRNQDGKNKTKNAEEIRGSVPLPDAMAAGVAKLQLSAHPFNHLGSRDLSRSDRRPRLRSDPHRNQFVTQVGRYLVTMMSTGVILAIGFQLSGGDSQMNTLIWYSWLGGVIIGTMIGANMVLEEHCKAGPRNVVITGSTRGLGKALSREFLLSGDRVVVASRRCPESVYKTVEELKENLKEGMSIAGSKGRTNLSHATVVGIACDVCKPEDVRKLANFAVDELGSVDIWINNAGTNKGFRPLLQFTDEDIVQGRALYAAEADRLRNWAESRARFSFTDAMEMYMIPNGDIAKQEMFCSISCLFFHGRRIGMILLHTGGHHR